MLKNVCGEKLGKSLLKRLRTMETSASHSAKVRTGTLQSVKRLFARMKRVEKIAQKVSVSILRETQTLSQLSFFKTQYLEQSLKTDHAVSKIEFSVSNFLSMKNDALKKVLRAYQKRTADEDNLSKTMGRNIRNGEAIATGSAIVSLFSFLFYTFDWGCKSLAKWIREIESTFEIFSFNGVQNV